MITIKTKAMITIIYILLLMALFVGAWFVVEIGKRSDYPKYLEHIIYLERLIDKCNVDVDSFDFILKEFDVINQFRKRDMRRNQEAFVKFSFKFKEEWGKRIEKSY